VSAKLSKGIDSQLGKAVRVKTAMGGGPILNGNKILGLSSGQITAMGKVSVSHFQKLNESGGPKIKDSLGYGESSARA